MILFFQESNGDFLAIDTGTNRHHPHSFEGRATAIAGLIGSVCTTGISRDFLKGNCKRVAKAKLPSEWRRAIGL